MSTSVPVGPINVNCRSLTQLCVPIRLMTFTSVIFIAVAMGSVHVTVGVPFDGIVIGTFVLLSEKHETVVNENADDHGPAQAALPPRTRHQYVVDSASPFAS